MGITHAFTNPKSDGADTTIVRPSDWNADHVGVLYSPDYPPGSPSAYDCEFDSALSGWTTLGSPTTSEANVIASNYHLYVSSTGAFSTYGIYKACPSLPFTVTMKISDMRFEGNYQTTSLMVLESSPGKIFQMGILYGNGVPNYGYSIWTNRTTRSSWGGDKLHSRWMPYVRLVVTSSTNISTQASIDCRLWTPMHSSINPGFTVANVGICVTGQDNSVAADAIIDWIRFT